MKPRLYEIVNHLAAHDLIDGATGPDFVHAVNEVRTDPMENLHQTLSVGGEQMQEARAGDMIHTLYELIEYGSSIITLFPGDVINNGTSGGVGMGTAVRGEQRFLRPGDVIEATNEGIGTLTIPVVGEEEPAGGTGARLPPVRSYRGRR